MAMGGEVRRRGLDTVGRFSRLNPDAHDDARRRRSTTHDDDDDERCASGVRSRGKTYQARGRFLRPRDVGVSTARCIAHVVALIIGFAHETVGGGRGDATRLDISCKTAVRHRACSIDDGSSGGDRT